MGELSALQTRTPMLALEKGPNDLIFQSKKPERSKIRPKLKGQTMVDTSETEKQSGQQCHGDTCCFGKRRSGRLSPALSRLSVLTQKHVGQRRSGFQTVSSHTCHTHLHSVLGIRAQAKNKFISVLLLCSAVACLRRLPVDFLFVEILW